MRIVQLLQPINYTVKMHHRAYGKHLLILDASTLEEAEEIVQQLLKNDWAFTIPSQKIKEISSEELGAAASRMSADYIFKVFKS